VRLQLPFLTRDERGRESILSFDGQMNFNKNRLATGQEKPAEANASNGEIARLRCGNLKKHDASNDRSLRDRCFATLFFIAANWVTRRWARKGMSKFYIVLHRPASSEHKVSSRT